MSSLGMKVSDVMQNRHMVSSGDHIVVGVSGGADSICLLHVLSECRARLQLELRAVHVHHGLRKTADRDEEYTRECCEKWNIPLTVIHVKAQEEAARRGRSIEETGRDLRYAAMRQVLASWQKEGSGYEARSDIEPTCGSKAAASGEKEGENESGFTPHTQHDGWHIAVAHHLEDSAETVLLNLSRGSSLAGLTGIHGMQGDIIRPLICCSRAEIEAYLRANSISWCTDETNDQDTYTRNFIRHHILPALTANVNDKAAEHISRTAEDLQEAEDFLQSETQKAMAACRQGSAYSKNKLLTLHPYLRRRVLYAMLLEAAGAARDLTYKHVEELGRLLESTGTGSVDLPGGLQAVLSYDRLIIGRENLTDDPGRGWEGLLRREDYEIRVLPFDGDMTRIPSGPYTKWLDYDKIGQFPTFRTREPGDKMAISQEHSKKLTRIMIDQQIPEPIRDRIVLPAAGQSILWLPGYRIGADYRVGTETRTILELHAAGWESRQGGHDGREDFGIDSGRRG